MRLNIRTITRFLVAVAVTGVISMTSFADTYKDSNGDVFVYQVDNQGVLITSVEDNRDGKMVVPGKIFDTSVYSFSLKMSADVSSLDLSQCTDLIYFNSMILHELTSLDVSNNTELKSLTICNAQLKKLDVSKNTKLVSLNCNSNQLTSLDVSKNTELVNLICGDNKLTSLDVSKNTKLEELQCHKNQLKNTDTSLNTNLKFYNCSYNLLTSLDVSKNTKLKLLDCEGNQLTSLDVSKNTDLEELYCSKNKLTNIDVSKNKKLKNLYCNSNKLTNLDTSLNTNLQRLQCYDNQLLVLDLTNNNQLSSLSIHNIYAMDNYSTTIEILYLPKGWKVADHFDIFPNLTIYVGGELYRQGLTSTSTPTPTEEPTATPTIAEEPTVTPTAVPTATPIAIVETTAPSETPIATPVAVKTESEVKVKGMTYAISSASGKTVTVKDLKKTKTKVSIPATVKIDSVKYKVTKIADKAFAGNKKLKQVTIGKNITAIGKEAFSGCSGLKTVMVKSTVLKKVGKNAFKGIAKKSVFNFPKAKAKKYQPMFKKAAKGSKISFKKS